MTYGAFLIGNPLFWSAVSGVCVGGAIASATRRVKNEPRPDRSRSRKWTAAALWFTAGILAATGGLLFPNAADFLAPPVLYVGLGALVFSACALRFPRAGGIPAILIIALIGVTGPFVMRAFVPIRDRGEAAEIRLLAVDEDGVYVEIEDFTPGVSGNSRVVFVDRPTLGARVFQLEVSDYLFFLGARGGLAFDSLVSGEATTADEPASVQGTPFHEAPFLRWVVDRVPLLALAEAESDPVRLGLLKPYRVVGFPDGSVEILPTSALE